MIQITKQQVLSAALAIGAGIGLGACALSTLAAPKLKPRIIQTNFAGDNVSIIDPVTNKVVGHITGIELNHGVAVNPNGKFIYVSDETNQTLDVADGKTFQVVNRIALSGHPNNITISHDGARVYVAIVGKDGGVDVVVDYGGLFGLGTRPIGVPIEAMVVLGDVMEIVDLTPAQLDKFPTFDGPGTTPILPDEIVKVGLARPSH